MVTTHIEELIEERDKLRQLCDLQGANIKEAMRLLAMSEAQADKATGLAQEALDQRDAAHKEIAQLKGLLQLRTNQLKQAKKENA